MTYIAEHQEFARDKNKVPIKSFQTITNYKLTTEITKNVAYQLPARKCKYVLVQNCNDKTATTKTLANDIYVGTSQALAIDGIRVRQEGSEELSVLNTNQIWIYTSSESIDIRIKVGD